MKCVAHLQGFNWECQTRDECENGRPESDLSDSVLGDTDNSVSETEEEEEDEPRTYKDDTVLRDQQSTGRKRAAKAYPLDETALCEWSMKKNCGGGYRPITGCLAGLQQARHHGPDKNTLNNDKGNVHRICHTCHNRWHTLNDPGYVWNSTYDRHDPFEATIIDIESSEDFWSSKKLTRPEH